MKSTRQLCQSSNKQFLLVFADFILKEYNIRLSIESFIEPISGKEHFTLLLPSKAIGLEAEITKQLDAYQSNPNHPQYIQASWSVGDSDTTLSEFSLQGGVLSDLKEKALPLTTTLIFISLIVYILMFFFPTLKFLFFYPASSEQYHQIWRFITHAFLHFSLLHILVNSMWLWYLGLQIEKRLGFKKLLFIFILSAGLSGLGQNWATGYLFGGLSGVVYALTGFCWLYGLLLPKKDIFLPNAILIFSMVWIGIGYSQALFDNIGNEAHLVGLLVGLCLAFCDYFIFKMRLNKENKS